MALKWEFKTATPEEIERLEKSFRIVIKPEKFTKGNIPPGPWPGKYDHLEESFLISIKKDKSNGS